MRRNSALLEGSCARARVSRSLALVRDGLDSSSATSTVPCGSLAARDVDRATEALGVAAREEEREEEEEDDDDDDTKAVEAYRTEGLSEVAAPAAQAFSSGSRLFFFRREAVGALIFRANRAFSDATYS